MFHEKEAKALMNSCMSVQNMLVRQIEQSDGRFLPLGR